MSMNQRVTLSKSVVDAGPVADDFSKPPRRGKKVQLIPPETRVVWQIANSPQRFAHFLIRPPAQRNESTGHGPLEIGRGDNNCNGGVLPEKIPYYPCTSIQRIG